MKRPCLLFWTLLFATLACTVTLTEPPTPVPTPVHAAPPGLTEIPMQVGSGVRGPFYELYFTDPFNPEAFRAEGGPDQPLVRAIDAARLSVDLAAYSLDLYSVRQALIDAARRGVTVRLVMETSNLDGDAPQALLAAGIPITDDKREGLMHDKFVVIDRAEVWTGSMNFTTSGTYEDNNNLIRVRSTQLAEDYTVEFEEMFKDDFFGADALAETPNPRVTVDGVPIEVYFSPDDRVASRLVELLRGARESIYFMAYSFTANDLGEVIRQKARQGLKVAGVMETDQIKSNEGTEYVPFAAARLPVFPDGNPGQMHHKVIVIDERLVITGSYNFSASAERTNDENLLIFFDRRIAAQYLAEFQRVLAAAQK